MLEDVADSGVAVYHIAGWFDPMANTTFAQYATLAPKLRSKITAMPNYHAGISPQVAKNLGADPTLDVYGSEGFWIEHLRWYDRWLKGIDNGVDKEEPIELFVMNKGWRSESEWPLQREHRTRLYFDQDAALSSTLPESGSDTYTADFTHNSQLGPFQDSASISAANAIKGKPPYKGAQFGVSRQQMIGVPQDAPIRAESEVLKTLNFTSEPLESDTEVTGYAEVNLWVSSSADYGDLFFYLEDVDEAGNAFLVTQYQQRVGFNTKTAEDVSATSFSIVRPEAALYGTNEADYTDQVFADGRVVNVNVSLFPTAWVFRKGHRLRLSVTAADWPDFELHPKLSPSNDPVSDDNIVPILSVKRGGETASYLDLPVVLD